MGWFRNDDEQIVVARRQLQLLDLNSDFLDEDRRRFGAFWRFLD
jgi:hypothetical protein